jgi:solute carrier family 25 (adenine nucleotide translocator) protein 4/5/6/31
MGEETKTKSLVNYAQEFALELALGGLSAAVSKSMVAPLERVKLLMQTRTGYYKNVWACIGTTYQQDGLLQFWRGNASNIARYFPTQALNFAFKGW